MRILLFIVVLIAMLTTIVGCKGKKANKRPTTTEASMKYDLPPMPPNVYQELRNSCTGVDYIFHNLPFSINQSEKASILTNLNFFSSEKIEKLGPDCKPLGREFFQADGDIVYEADIYFSDACYAYVFFKGGNAIYANKISPDGMDFYKKITTSVGTKAR